MRFSMLQLLKNLRHHSQGKEIGDADILNWANGKVKRSGRSSQMESFKVTLKTLIIQLLLYMCLIYVSLSCIIRIKASQLVNSFLNF